MTNKERLFMLSEKELAAELCRIFRHPLMQFLDYEAYLKSDNPSLIPALKTIGAATKIPSSVEVMDFRNQHRNDPDIETKVKEFKQTHTSPCLLLEQTSIYNSLYWTIFIPGENEDNFIKTPAEFITNIILKDGSLTAKGNDYE